MLRFRQAPGLGPCFGLGAAQRPLGPKAGQFQAPAATSLTSLGEPVVKQGMVYVGIDFWNRPEESHAICFVECERHSCCAEEELPGSVRRLRRGHLRLSGDEVPGGSGGAGSAGLPPVLERRRKEGLFGYGGVHPRGAAAGTARFGQRVPGRRGAHRGL